MRVFKKVKFLAKIEYSMQGILINTEKSFLAWCMSMDERIMSGIVSSTVAAAVAVASA